MTTQTSKNWQHIKIGHLGRIVTGKTPPTKNQEYYGDRYPFITPTDISESSIFVEKPDRYLSESGARKIASSKLPKNSVCYTCIASVGKITITKEDSFTNQQINSIIANPDKADFRYIFYLLRNITSQIKRMVGGVASPIINKSDFENIDIEIPEIKIQKQIADVLSRYDDLIENNTRRIKILEQMVQAIYAEWFVNFRFPGYEKIKMVDSGADFGKIPEGWSVENLSELVDFVRGIEPGSDNYKLEHKEGRIPFLRVGDLGSRGSNIFIDRDIAGDNFINKADIAVTMDGTVGRVAIGFYGAYSTGIRKLMIKNTKINREYLYLLMLSDLIQEVIKSHAKGTTILHASESIKYMQCVLPSKEIMDKLCISAKPLIDGILVLREQNQNLRQMRDLLLPKLVTGKLEIKS